MALSQVKTYVKAILRRKRIEKQESPLLNLPLDLIFDIFDLLDKREKVAFSRACRGLQHHLHRKCISSFRQATGEDRLIYLDVLASLMPYHYFCPRCEDLHRMHPEDIPFGSIYHYVPNYRSPCPLPEPLESRIVLHHQYSIAFRHIQLAVKLSAANCRGSEKRYLKNLLRTHTDSIGDPFTPNSCTARVATEPRVVRGRLMLKTMFQFGDGRRPLSFASLMDTFMNFCPHHFIGRLRFTFDPIVLLISTMFEKGEGPLLPGPQHAAFSCPRCPSDARILTWNGALYVFIWRDLGTGSSIEDPCWLSHVETDWDNCYEGKVFEYEHGSVEARYHSVDK